MTDFEQYKEHIEYTFNAFCKIVIRHAAIDESRRLKSTWEHEISFEYLTEEKFYPFSTEDVYFAEPEERPEYPIFICAFTNTTTTKKSARYTDITALQSAAISRNPCGCCMRKWRWCPMGRKLLPYENIVKAQEATVNAEKFMSIVRKYLSIEELTHTLLREMVEKIVVYECEYDENEVRRQRIDIYYSFVGKIDLPEE